MNSHKMYIFTYHDIQWIGGSKTTTYKRVLICYFMMSQTNNQEMLLKGDPPLSKPPL